MYNVHHYANILQIFENRCLQIYPAIKSSKYRVNPLDGRRGSRASCVPTQPAKKGTVGKVDNLNNIQACVHHPRTLVSDTMGPWSSMTYSSAATVCSR